MSFSGLPNMIPISERSKVEKTQSNYHTAVTSREIALLAVNVNWGLDSFINESQVMRNTSLSLHWLLVKSPVILLWFSFLPSHFQFPTALFSLNITFYTAFCSFLRVAVSFISLNMHWEFSPSLRLCLTGFLLPAQSVSSMLFVSAHLAFVWSFLLELFLRCLVILGHLLLWGSGN